MKLHKLYLPHALGLIFFSGASLSHAQITEWQTTTQNWFTPANWNNGTPTLTVPALIDNGGTAQVTSAGAETLNLIPSVPTLRPADILTSAASPSRLAALDIGIVSPDSGGAGDDCCDAMNTHKRERYAEYIGELE